MKIKKNTCPLGKLLLKSFRLAWDSPLEAYQPTLIRFTYPGKFMRKHVTLMGQFDWPQVFGQNFRWAVLLSCIINLFFIYVNSHNRFMSDF